jgi:carbon-monoxide dehydrogenase small subunit
MADRITVHATINGEALEFSCDPDQTLLECLRETLGLYGPKIGCGDGNCGACAVIVDGRLVNSCLVLGAEVEGAEVVTIEGLARWPGLHSIQRAFVEADGLQCGYCTPGMIMATKALLDAVPDPTDEQIREWMAGNLCRCTGYETILQAVRAAAEQLGG